MVFKRNRKFSTCVVLKEATKGRWVSNEPLFIGDTKALYPIFKTGGPTGAFPKNHQEFELKDIKEDNKDDEFSGL